MRNLPQFGAERAHPFDRNAASSKLRVGVTGCRTDDIKTEVNVVEPRFNVVGGGTRLANCSPKGCGSEPVASAELYTP